MKARRGEIERALELEAPGSIRLFLLHGPDLAGSQAHAARLTTAVGAAAERLTLSPATLKADPARLIDEAASFSLFGDTRVIIVEGGGDELLDAVTGLLEAPAVGNPVAIVTGALKKGSKLLALVEGSLRAMASASYVPEGREAERIVIDLGRAAGLQMSSDVARRLAESGAGDRAAIARELDKFALYLDAALDRPAVLDDTVVDALSAGNDEGDVSRVVDAVLDGSLPPLDYELRQLSGSGDAVVVVRALSRRLLQLSGLRSEVEQGNSVASVIAGKGKSLFFKDKASIERQLSHWTATRLVTASSRILDAERDLKSPGSLGNDAVTEPLFAIAQAAARRR